MICDLVVACLNVLPIAQNLFQVIVYSNISFLFFFTFWGRSLGKQLLVSWKQGEAPEAAGSSSKSFQSIELFRKFSFVAQSTGFGGLGVACSPLVPKFAGSNQAEAVGFLGRKNPQHAFLRRGSKAVGPMS